MTDQHPITPPPELVQRLLARFHTGDTLEATWAIAAQWGWNQREPEIQAAADAELDACCEWLDYNCPSVGAHHLRADRRPKPPSLKERLSKAIVEGDERQALKLLEELDSSPMQPQTWPWP